jgi:hypothetical protein
MTQGYENSAPLAQGDPPQYDASAEGGYAHEEIPNRSAPNGTAERVTIAGQDRPLTNEQARKLGTLADLPDELREMAADAEQRLRKQTLGEAGQEPENIEHHISVAGVLPADRAPGAFYGMSGTYVFGERDIFASSVGQIVTSYTFDSTTVTADANGDKIVYEGTVLAASGAKVQPRTSSAAAVGVLRHRINCRYGDIDIGMVIGGRLRADKLWDNGAFGSVASGAVTQLAALGIYLTTYDA